MYLVLSIYLNVKCISNSGPNLCRYYTSNNVNFVIFLIYENVCILIKIIRITLLFELHTWYNKLTLYYYK